MKERELSIAFLVVVVAIGACGCHFAPRKVEPEAGRKTQKDIALTYNQIRLRMRSLVGPMCGEIQEAADGIVAATTNRTVQRAALEWKLEAVPAMRGALFQPDPVTALMDGWALCMQMGDFFEAGPGKAALGDASPGAVAVCRQLEEKFAQVAATITVSGDVSRTRAYVRQWAADHPIKHSIAGRESASSRVLVREAAAALSTGEAVADVTTSLDDLNRRLEVYTEQVVRQARWEAELLKSELMAEAPINQAVPLAERAVRTAEQAEATLERLAPIVERAAATAESAPKLIDSEREQAIKALQTEFTRTIQSFHEERIAFLGQLTEERVAAMKSLEQSLELHRKGLSQDLDRISTKAVGQADRGGAQLSVLILVGIFIGLLVLLLLARRLFPPAQNVKA